MWCTTRNYTWPFTVLFLPYVNATPMAVKCNLILYAHDTSLIFQIKNVDDIDKQLNEDFEKICSWLVDNKLSIEFGEDKTKSIFLASKRNGHIYWNSLTENFFFRAWYPNLSENLRKKEFRLLKTSVFVFAYSWIKWHIYLKKFKTIELLINEKCSL